MSLLIMIKCDNPSCRRVAEPEARDAKGKPTRPPYGWFVIKGHCQGILTTFKLTVCRSECIHGAVERESRRQNENGDEDDEG